MQLNIRNYPIMPPKIGCTVYHSPNSPRSKRPDFPANLLTVQLGSFTDPTNQSHPHRGVTLGTRPWPSWSFWWNHRDGASCLQIAFGWLNPTELTMLQSKWDGRYTSVWWYQVIKLYTYCIYTSWFYISLICSYLAWFFCGLIFKHCNRLRWITTEHEQHVRFSGPWTLNQTHLQKNIVVKHETRCVHGTSSC